MLLGPGPDLVQGLPKAERPVAGGKLGVEHQAILVPQAEQQLAPALGALAKTVLDCQQLLAPAGIGTDQHQQTLALVLHDRPSFQWTLFQAASCSACSGVR